MTKKEHERKVLDALYFFSKFTGKSVESLLKKMDKPILSSWVEFKVIFSFIFDRKIVVENPATTTLRGIVDQVIDDDKEVKARSWA